MTIKNKLLASIGLVAALGFNAHANAASSGNSEFVKDVDINFGYAAIINIKNTSANKNLSAINLNVQENKLDFTIKGSVTCKDKNKVKFWGAHAYFGGVGIGGLGGLSTSGTLHTDTIDVAYTDGDHPIAEYTEDTFSVPLNEVKIGHPALRVDALEELAKKLQTHVQGGGKEIDFYKTDQEIVLQRPISLAAICGKNGDNTVGFETKSHTIQIKYKGDPSLKQPPLLNAQLGQMPQQINNDLPIHLDKADFQPNLPHYTGKCMPDANPKIQIDLQFSGNGAGYMDLRVQSVSNIYAAYGPYHNFSNIPVNAQASKKIDFHFPLKTMLAQEKYSYMAISNSKTYNHNMKIEARYKPKEGGVWSAWKDFDTAVYKHRCIPILNGQVGNIGGTLGGYQGQNDPNASKTKLVPLNQANKTKKPARATLTPTPDPVPQLKIVVPQSN